MSTSWTGHTYNFIIGLMMSVKLLQNIGLDIKLLIVRLV